MNAPVYFFITLALPSFFMTHHPLASSSCALILFMFARKHYPLVVHQVACILVMLFTLRIVFWGNTQMPEFKGLLSSIQLEPYPIWFRRTIALFSGRKDAWLHSETALFKNNGLSHLLAVSGLHIQMILTVITLLLGRLPRNPRILICCLLLPLIILGCGLRVSVIRAVSTAFLHQWGQLTARPLSFKDCMLYSATFTLLLAPQSLLRLDFQLSYGATAAIGICLYWQNHQNKMNWISSSIITSATIYILTGIFLYIHGIEFHPIYMIINIIMIPYFSIYALSHLFATILYLCSFPTAILHVPDFLHSILMATLQTLQELPIFAPTHHYILFHGLLVWLVAIAHGKHISFIRKSIIMTGFTVSIALFISTLFNFRSIL
jgi:ComEC/Rec2-related protein